MDAQIWIVWACTDDFYDQGYVSSIHRTQDGAKAAAAQLRGTDVSGVGTIMTSIAEAWPLQD